MCKPGTTYHPLVHLLYDHDRDEYVVYVPSANLVETGFSTREQAHEWAVTEGYLIPN